MNIHPLFIPSTNQQAFLSHAQPQPHQPQQNSSLPTRSSSCSSATSSSSDSEQSKKKRGGRKNREVSIAQAPLKPLTRILPAAAAPAEAINNNNARPYSPPHHQQEENGHDVVKQESSTPPSIDQLPSPPQQQQQYLRSSISSTTPTPGPEKTPAEVAYAKRQERLIKNRAAALLSRKRKREHLTSLEDERQQLVNENQSLHQKVSSLEARVVSLEQENMELKQQLSPPTTGSIHKQYPHYHNSSSLATPKHTKTTGMVFMIILFSFAFFSLPSSHSSDQLTVGGGGSAKPNIPLIGTSPSRVPEIRLETIDTGAATATADTPNTTTDLMLIDHVRPLDLQSWIKQTLVQQKHQQQHDQHETGLTHWQDEQAAKGLSHQHLYLYTDKFSQAAQLHENQHEQTPLASTTAIEPTLSILCPLNTSTSCEPPTYLQIDVQILGSRVLEGELRHKSTSAAATTGVPSSEGGISIENDGDISMFDSVMAEKLAKTNDLHRPDDSTAKPSTSSTDRLRQLRKQVLDKKRRRFSRVVLD
ncbi:unnamed protein product [Absidia cylindrospora]